jgi:hypothetical protein
MDDTTESDRLAMTLVEVLLQLARAAEELEQIRERLLILENKK